MMPKDQMLIGAGWKSHGRATQSAILRFLRGGPSTRASRTGITIPAIDDRDYPPVKSVEEAIAARPEWIKYEISEDEALALADEIRHRSATTAMEIGVASGYSSAILYSALAEGTKRPKLYSLDWSKACYFDKTRSTGDAFYEIHGREAGYSLTTGLHSGMLNSAPVVDFMFIDANHQNPWPALDLMSLGRFIRPGGVVALHDFEMIYHSWGRHASGARDLFRCWLGEKWRREKSSNIGFLVFDMETMLRSLPVALMTDWDLEIKGQYLERFVGIAEEFPSKLSRPIVESIRKRSGSHRSTKLLAPR